jgi:hypothetical protein
VTRDSPERLAVPFGPGHGLEAVLEQADRVAGRAARLQGRHRAEDSDVQREGLLGLARVDESKLLSGAVLRAGEPGSRQLADVSSFPRTATVRLQRWRVSRPCRGYLEDANVRAAMMDARDVGPSGRFRLRCVIKSPW